MKRRREFMSDEVWNAVLYLYIVPYQHVNSYCPPTFIGHKDGEPLLNKRLPDRLRQLSEVCPDMKIDVYSHGLLLPKWRERGQDFMEFLAGLPNPSRFLMSYHPRNHDGSYNDYERTIEYMRDVLQHPPKNVEFVTVSHKSKWVSQSMQDAWRNCWEGLPITVHSNAFLNPWTGRIEEEGTIRFCGCPYADFGHWFIGVTGNIVACCLDLEEEIVLGNVLKDSPVDVLRRTDEFYTLQRNRQVRHQVCANCFGMSRTDITADLLQVGMILK